MTAFATTDELAEYLGQFHDPTDTKMIWALEIASEMVRAEINYTADMVADDELTLDGTGTDALLLPEVPVSEIDSISVDDTALESTDWKLDTGGIVYRVDDVWTLGRGNVVVTYTHGYAEGSVADGLVALVLTVAARMYRTVGLAGDITSETIGDYSYTISDTIEGAQSLTADESMLASKYRIGTVR